MTKLRIFNRHLIIIYLIFFIFNGILKPINAQKLDSCNQKGYVIEENVNFYKFVIKKYADFIKMMYENNYPFFIIVDNMYYSVKSNVISVELTYTKKYEVLKSFTNTDYYQYDNSENIFIVLAEFQGDTTFRNDFKALYNIKRINEDVLTEKFYPLTFEGFVEDLTKGKDENVNIVFDKNPVNTNDIFIVTKIGKSITAYIRGGKNVVYFDDYAFD